MRRRLLVAAIFLAGFSPFKAEERNVREGNERQATGDPAGALPRYDAAERAVGARPEIDYDKGDALFRLGKSAEAREAWKRSLQKGAGPLGSRAQQNTATALSSEGDREGAIAAFTEALRLDSQNEDARFGLEVLLRRKEAEERAKQGSEPRPAPAPGKEGAAEPNHGEQEPGKEEHRKAGPGEPRPSPAKEPAPPPSTDRRAGEAERGPAGGEAPLSREEAGRLLDALRSREQAMPVGGVDRRKARRANGDRDW